MGREVNLKIAKWAVEKTRRLVPFSTNRNTKHTTYAQEVLLGLTRLKVPKPIKEQIQSLKISPQDGDYAQDGQEVKLTDLRGEQFLFDLPQLADLLRDEYETKIRGGYHRDGTWRTSFHDIENNARNSVDNRVGNCAELSAIAYCLLLECPDKYRENYKIKFEYFSLKSPGDHCFIIIGRKPLAKLHDMNTWGGEAVICDPWGNSSWLVSDVLKKHHSDRPSLFNYIDYHFRRHGVSFSHVNHISAGHSRRWQDKHRGELRLRCNYSIFSSRNSLPAQVDVQTNGSEERDSTHRVRR